MLRADVHVRRARQPPGRLFPRPLLVQKKRAVKARLFAYLPRVRYSYLNLRLRAASDFFLRLTEGFS